MSLKDFWLNVRLGTGDISPKVVSDSSRVDTARIEDRLRAANLWLTVKSVEGFIEGDFAFLEASERQRLVDAVHRFRAVASKVRPDGPATPEQEEQARAAFREIIEILSFDRFADIDAFVTGKQIEQKLSKVLPAWVREMRFESGDDANGVPALWIWVVVDDEAADSDGFFEKFSAVREQIEAAVREVSVNPPRWPYIRLRTVSELAPVTD